MLSVNSVAKLLWSQQFGKQGLLSWFPNFLPSCFFPGNGSRVLPDLVETGRRTGRRLFPTTLGSHHDERLPGMDKEGRKLVRKPGKAPRIWYHVSADGSNSPVWTTTLSCCRRRGSNICLSPIFLSFRLVCWRVWQSWSSWRSSSDFTGFLGQNGRLPGWPCWRSWLAVFGPPHPRPLSHAGRGEKFS